LTCLATGASEQAARVSLEQCDWHVKTAIVMIKNSLDVAAARSLLESVQGSVRQAMKQ
jgi:N-acetylmuramic acid 6-phosphate etherase